MKGNKTINNNMNGIDSQDVIDRIAYLEGSEDDDDKAEHAILTALAEEAEGYASDWRHGETLIRDSYFKAYAKELAEDCGMLGDLDTWPGRCIDWDQAAEELKQDYTSIDFDGVDYWIRCS